MIKLIKFLHPKVPQQSWKARIWRCNLHRRKVCFVGSHWSFSPRLRSKSSWISQGCFSSSPCWNSSLIYLSLAHTPISDKSVFGCRIVVCWFFFTFFHNKILEKRKSTIFFLLIWGKYLSNGPSFFLSYFLEQFTLQNSVAAPYGTFGSQWSVSCQEDTICPAKLS